MIRASYIEYPLLFVRPAGTSRGILERKPCWFIRLTSSRGEEGQGETGPGDTGLEKTGLGKTGLGKTGLEKTGLEKTGLGEVSYIPGLSVEDPDTLEMQLDHVCQQISRGELDPARPLPALPGVQFALETALMDLKNGGRQLLYPSEFTAGRTGIRTNGLIWMGAKDFMISQIQDKILLGFRVLKLKVGSLRFEEELDLLRWIRTEFASSRLEIRLDANGAWTPDEAREKIGKLSRWDIHSIEQPIAAGQPEELAKLCRESPIPVALDEELIGRTGPEERRRLMDLVRPAYLILKPGLLGGFTATEEWISLAEKYGAGWWVTSALESNVGLNAIAQWTWQLGIRRHQGLGTGALYTNNLPSPLQMSGEQLWFRPEKAWDMNALKW